MKLSESIRRNVLETAVGNIVNKFKLKKRRDTFFFDDIGLNYVKALEDNGYGEKLRSLSYKWGVMLYTMAVPSPIKKLPYTISCNVIVKETLVNLGYMDDMRLSKKGDTLELRTKGEENIKKIGMNNLHIGMFMGMCAVFLNSGVSFREAKTFPDGGCMYKFSLLKRPVEVETKGKETYNRLNTIPATSGSTIKNALKSNIFVMKDNKMFFRGKRITAIENTLFHLFSNEGMMLDQVSRISYEYFSEVIKASSMEEKLKLLKNLLQFMGWGLARFEVRGRKKILMVLKYPPFGFQTEKDNWRFLCEVVRGYLWLVDRGFKLQKMRDGGKRISAEYAS